MIKRTFLIAFATFFLASFSFSKTKEEKVYDLLEMTNALAFSNQFADLMMQQFAPLFPKEALPVIEEVLKSTETKEFEDLMIKLYDKFYSEAEIDAMIAFYSTPAGISIMEKMPQVMQESMQVGNYFGQQKAMEFMEKMKEKGFEPTSI